MASSLYSISNRELKTHRGAQRHARHMNPGISNRELKIDTNPHLISYRQLLCISNREMKNDQQRDAEEVEHHREASQIEN